MRKIFNILLLGFLIITITGCGNTKSNVSKSAKDNIDITGSWTLSRKTAVSNSRYGSLKDLFGDMLGSGEGALMLNEDGTFSITLALAYNMTGNYHLKDNIITFSDIKDKNVVNKKTLKEREDNLSLEYIKYNNHEFMKMKLYDYDFDVYIFFEKNPTSVTGSYADDEIPEVTFDTSEGNGQTETNNKGEYSKTADGLVINGYTLKFGTYSGKYRTTQTESQKDSYTAEKKIKINSNDTVTMYGPMGEEEDYPYTVSDNTIKVGTSDIQVVGNNKVKFSNDNFELNYKAE